MEEENISISNDTTSNNDKPSSSSSTMSSSSTFQVAIQSLTYILPTTPPSLLSSKITPYNLLHDAAISNEISSLLHRPDSGVGDNNLCRWFYDTFQSSKPELQLIVLHFLPLISGLYLTRVHLRKPLAGFEAILLALYAHETTSRAGQSVTLSITNLANPSVYHDPNDLQNKSKASDSTEVNLVVVSPSLDPHRMVRSTKRARIIGVALELYHKNVALMPIKSKIDFCEFVELWAGQDGDNYKEELPSQYGYRKEKKKGRIPLPWELLQPVLKVLGHCLLGPDCMKDKELYEAACVACRSLYARALHEIDPNAILATRSLLRLEKMAAATIVDHTEIMMADTITLITSP